MSKASEQHHDSGYEATPKRVKARKIEQTVRRRFSLEYRIAKPNQRKSMVLVLKMRKPTPSDFVSEVDVDVEVKAEVSPCPLSNNVTPT